MPLTSTLVPLTLVGGGKGGITVVAARPLPKIWTMVPGASSPFGLGSRRCSTPPWAIDGATLGVTPPTTVLDTGGKLPAFATTITARGLAAKLGDQLAEYTPP